MNTSFIIVGLGNPGPAYTFTRHNAGFLVVDALAEKYGAAWKTKNNVQTARVVIEGHNCLLVKPLTFMNTSGTVLPALVEKDQNLATVIVVHDELELPFGTLKIKTGGGARGHNGLRSIIAHIGPDFTRLALGIGRPADKSQVADYVLASFSEGRQSVALVVQQALTAIEHYIAQN